MKNLYYFMIAFASGILCTAVSDCKPEISTPMVATAKTQGDFPKVDPSQLVAQPPVESEEPAKQADVKPKSSHPMDMSIQLLTLIATLCMHEGEVNDDCVDTSVGCTLKIEPELPGALQKVRECVKHAKEGK